METLIMLAIFVGITLLFKKKKGTPKLPKEKNTTTYLEKENEAEITQIENTIDQNYIRQAYETKWLFTQNEKRAYYKLNNIAKKQGYIVFAKVRLFDLVTPRKDHPKYKTNLWKIQAKHVDFVITKENLVAKYVIELDDSSHNTPDRKERDIFVDNVLTTCGYKVLHTKEIQEEEIIKFLST